MEAKQTPLIELLERIPQDARLIVEHDQFSSSSHPVGRLCHEAAAALRAALAAQPVMLEEHCLWARNGNQPCPHVQQADPGRSRPVWNDLKEWCKQHNISPAHYDDLYSLLMYVNITQTNLKENT